MRIRWLCLLLLLSGPVSAEPPPAVLIGLDAEIGHKTSTSDDAIRLGIEIAIDEINSGGGVLNGRPLELIVNDNRSVPARGIDNFRALASKRDLIAVIGGKFSPVMLAQLPLAHEFKLPLLSPWSATDGIIDHDFKPSYTFRLSLRDGWIMPRLFSHAEQRGIAAVGLMVPNGAWGRGNAEIAAKHAKKNGKVRLTQTLWYEWTDEDFRDEYQTLVASGARAILFVGNEAEGARLARLIASLPKDKRLPVLSHWGLSGGDYFGLAGAAANEVDLSLAQSFSFLEPLNPRGRYLLDQALRRKQLSGPERLLSPVGIAQAYDLTHLLALAINKAGSTDREKIRDALENLGAHEGAIRKYAPAFTRDRHEALGPEQIFMAHWRADGALVKTAK